MGNRAVEKAIENVRAKSKGDATSSSHAVTVNFHPDRYTSDNTPLLLTIANDGFLRSQFETGTSNGGLTAFSGGERWSWEQRVFDGAYDKAPDRLRPKYGALNFRDYESGGSPRFGSCYFQLKPEVLNRTTFCYPDSYFEPDDFGVHDRLNLLIDKASSADSDLLDDYIEAHIHGEVSVKEDIESLVLDPVYRGGIIEEHALELGVPVRWHRGFRLSIKEMSLYPNYRGPQFIELAKELAQGGFINPELLGLAVTEQGYDEQDIKKIWHYLARFGYG